MYLKTMLNEWMKIKFPKSELQLSSTLLGGQSFRWRKMKSDEAFLGTFCNIVWIIRQTDDELWYKIVGELPYKSEQSIRLKVPPPKKLERATVKPKALLYPSSYYQKLLSSYFRLNIDIKAMYMDWKRAHKHFISVTDEFYAVRMLNQDPVENIFSFICSQNNNIQRISSLVEKLCTLFGEKICTYEDEQFYTFPDVSALTKENMESMLRSAGFGYRSKYIFKSATEIISKGQSKDGLDWLEKLSNMDYSDAKKELVTLTGIGPKVADCICLMSLNKLEAVPVDVHVFNIAKTYLPHLAKLKSVTPKVYDEIGDKFREIYGNEAGWAQTVLFCADLRQFKKS